MATTALQIIEQARIRHWSFADVQLGDGAALLFLNQRQRTLLLKYRDALKGIIETTASLTYSGGAYTLPADLVTVTARPMATLSSGEVIPVTVVSDNRRGVMKPGHRLLAYLQSATLIPIRAPAQAQDGTLWTSVSAVRLSYLACPTLSALTSNVTLPTVLLEALVQAVVDLFTVQSKESTPQAIAAASARLAAEAQLGSEAFDIVGDMIENGVIFTG